MKIEQIIDFLNDNLMRHKKIKFIKKDNEFEIEFEGRKIRFDENLVILGASNVPKEPFSKN